MVTIIEIKKLLHIDDGSLSTIQKINRAYRKIRKNSYKLKRSTYNIQALSSSAQEALLYKDAHNQTVMAKVIFVLKSSKVVYRLYFQERSLFYADVIYHREVNRFYFRDGELFKWYDSYNHTIQDYKLLKVKAKEIMRMVHYLQAL